MRLQLFNYIYSINIFPLQAKVRELYQLDQLLQEESGILQSLQRDKEDLERALGGLRVRIHDSNATPLALEAAKKQQHILERELSRVHHLLAENSKVAEVPSRSFLHYLLVICGRYPVCLSFACRFCN